MTPEGADLGGLAAFRDRLTGGIYGSIAATRRPDYAAVDGAQFATWPAEKPGLLGDIRGGDGAPQDGAPLATIKGFTAELRKKRELLTAVVFSPDLLQRRLVCLYGSSDQDLADCWMTMCWIAEAAWSSLADHLPADAGYAIGDAELLRPVAARMRFLVLSEAMRFRGQVEGTLWLANADAFGGSGVFDRFFGPDSWTDLVGRCRDARREWQECLDTFQSQPLLRQAKPEELERELRTLLFADGHAEPLVLSVRPLPERASLTPEDATVIGDSVERHLLPRFAMATVARLALYDDSRPRQWARRLFALAIILTGFGAAGCAAGLLVHPAVWLAAACYALICVGVVVFPGSWGATLLLRMPAASAVGIFALIAFMPGGWLQNPPGGWAAAAVLTAVSFGYLLVEARNHGVARRSAAPRAVFVVVVGAVHALMVSLIGLVVVAPALVANGDRMSEIWSKPGYGHAGVVLALAAAWCLTVGVFLQILWDERPITAPLAHLSWRK
jgi:hypothetical protein